MIKIITFEISGFEITSVTERIKKIGLKINYERTLLVNDEKKIFVIIFTNYMFRNNSDLTITVIIHFKSSSDANIDIISTGGKSGLFQMSLGSEKHNENKVYSHFEQICRDEGWILSI